MAWQKARIPIPDGYTKEQRQAIGKDICDFIRERCAVGVGVKKHGEHYRTYDFPEYSESYAKAKGQTRVDLKLEGEMLAALDVLSHEAGSILIGYRNGTTENGKAEGNQTGSYGGEANARRARSFLGLTRAELNAILAGYDKPRKAR